MRKTVRLEDNCSGHGCHTPRPTNSASTNVFINNRGSHRLSDTLEVHCCAGTSCHSGITVGGSDNVFVNNRKIGRSLDTVNCGSTLFQGSDNVLCNS
jgi:uncharacterized Zn-binding protein involved in type VI secretion